MGNVDDIKVEWNRVWVSLLSYWDFFFVVKLGERGTKKTYFQTAYLIDVHCQH